MSGGHWDYIQYRFSDITESIQRRIDNNGKELSKDDENYDEDWFKKYPEERFHYKYSDEVITEFKNAVDIIKQAEIYTQRVDWLLSGDDGEESFIERLNQELKKHRSKQTKTSLKL